MPRLAPVKRKKFEKFLIYVGCHLKRQKGDHLVYDRPGLKRPVVFTTDKEIPVFILRNNLRTLNVTPEEFLEIIKKI
jgi:predicted RNA binding protein YcfA (HicA-like mRNA interferase family)